jgi:hypothetical protein
MRTVYDPRLQAHITYDDADRVRNIIHGAPPAIESAGVAAMAEALDDPGDVSPEAATARDVATAYVRDMADLLRVPSVQMESASEAATNIAPRESPVQFRISSEKTLFDTTTIGFAQTVHEVPVWDSGITVIVQHDPYRVISADDGTIDVETVPCMPPPEVIARYQQLFAWAEASTKVRETRRKFERHAAVTLTDEWAAETTVFLRSLLYTEEPVEIIRGRFFIHRYDPEQRLPPLPEDGPAMADQAPLPAVPFALAAVPASIVTGAFYMVAEITFSDRELVWQMLVELEHGAVLLLRPLAASVSGMVFVVDPVTATGAAGNTPDKPNNILNPFRTSVQLSNLKPPVNGIQQLSGTRVELVDLKAPNAALPSRPVGQNFDYDVRTDDFAAVNAYYHVDQFFKVVESLGFPLDQYFKKTTFPIKVDHRSANTISASCIGNGTGGIKEVHFGLSDLFDMAAPLGRACDSRVVWHELGGHGPLVEWVNHANFKFAHSAGDSLSAIFHAPESRAADARRFAPWIAERERRNDRNVAEGWAWGGTRDDKNYGSEEILATTLFRMYLSVGGGSPNLERRRFASRVMLYLILRAIFKLTPATNPDQAEKFAAALMTADIGDWPKLRLSGNAYAKVIRWAFEKQGAYQPAGAPRPVVRPGAPPDVDVYIDDGRRGEYDFLLDHANTAAIWNRFAPDGGTTHQEPKRGVQNHAYVKIRNRGPKTATGVRVRGFHTSVRAGAVLRWPVDFQPMSSASIKVGILPGNNAPERIIGPFIWKPVLNAAGGDAMLMIVTATEDPSNADRFTSIRDIEDWRLVPNDNNIAQRNVRPS